MNKSLLKNIISGLILIVFTTVSHSIAQTQSENGKQVNFRYSQNPKTKIKTVEQKSDLKSENVEENQTIAAKTFEIAKRANSAALSPTEIYKIGVGDILIIGLQSYSSEKSGRFAFAPAI